MRDGTAAGRVLNARRHCGSHRRPNGVQLQNCNKPLHEFAALEAESTLTPARHGVTLAVRSLRPFSRPSALLNAEHSSTSSPQGTVHESS
jgi:hypothetical protein